jgi:hypothetical protein
VRMSLQENGLRCERRGVEVDDGSGIKLGNPKNSRKIRSKPLSHASYFYTIPSSLLVVEGYQLGHG